ncbi:hypothetical protein V502_05664 [Pseudogymnoascus sp. VKM F-4520 (FW-2644)]|nr:hypothetical protein V502_05664 [Pseudogymnoascus sp. VKM F-4520 (FW-2644)]
MRYNSNLGRGLLTPDGKGVVLIPISGRKRSMVLRGSGNANANLPAVRYDPALFKAKYPNWTQWRDKLLYRRRLNGTLHVKTFSSYTGNPDDSTPPDWPQGVTRDRTLASEVYYREKKLNLKTGLTKDAVRPNNEVRQAPAGAEDRKQKQKRKMPSVATDNFVVLSDSENEIDTLANPNKKKLKNAIAEHVPSQSLDRPELPTPALELPRSAIAPIEVHKAAIRAAFKDKSVNRTELFWTLLPYITLAEAEEILIRRKGAAEIEHE